MECSRNTRIDNGNLSKVCNEKRGKAIRKLYKRRTVFRDGVNYNNYINGMYIIIEK